MTKKADGTVVIDLGSPEAATHFARWLCGQGEQDYWMWMEERELDDEDTGGNITAIDFKYDYENAAIKGKMGRLSDKRSIT